MHAKTHFKSLFFSNSCKQINAVQAEDEVFASRYILFNCTCYFNETYFWVLLTYLMTCKYKIVKCVKKNNNNKNQKIIKAEEKSFAETEGIKGN